MPVTEKTRKILWGRSGSLCAICRAGLVVDPTDVDAASVVGEECHIVSKQCSGPRYDPTRPPAGLDDPENLLLLCRMHHKMVDDQVETFTSEVLLQIKENHENWVAATLARTEHEVPAVRIRRIRANVPTHLRRLCTGAELLGAAQGTMAIWQEHDEPASSDEAELLAGFLQDLQDYGDLDDLGGGERVRAGYRLSEAMDALSDAGFWVFGARELQRIEGGVGEPSSWPVFHLSVLRSTNQRILRGEGEEAAMGNPTGC